MRKERIKVLNLMLYGRCTLEEGIVASIGHVIALSSDDEVTKFITVIDESSKSEKRKIRACIDFIKDTGCDFSWTLSDVLAFNKNHWFLEDTKSKAELISWFLDTFQIYRSEPFSEDEINDALRNATITDKGTLVQIISINDLIPRNFYKTW